MITKKRAAFKERKIIMSSVYHGFAYVYDKFMDNIPYEDWSIYLTSLFKKYGITSGTLAELGCGTGTMSQLMAKAGFHILGVDLSEDMLAIAAEKTAHIPEITLLLQNMCDLDLGDSVDGVYCVCDSLNYLLYTEEILSTFKGVKAHLKNGGIFIFDLKTEFFYKEVLGDQVFCDHQENCSYTWENSYFEEDGINQYDLTLFAKVPETDLFERFCETHHQKAYSLSEIIDLLSEGGLEYVAAYDAFTQNPPNTESERIYIVARNGDSK
jgi:SAM-dependent methyltransferase